MYSEDKEDIGSHDLGVGDFYTNIKSRLMEFDVGVRKIWEGPKHIRPFIGIGLANIIGDVKAETFGTAVSDQDIGYGMWADIGAYVTVNERFNIGFDARWSKVQINLYGREARVGGWHFGALTGIHW
jgi:hypothetical protein